MRAGASSLRRVGYLCRHHSRRHCRAARTTGEGADRTSGADVDRSGTPHRGATSTSASKASPSAVSDNANLIARALATRAINT
jgi:hypothetical protein